MFPVTLHVPSDINVTTCSVTDPPTATRPVKKLATENTKEQCHVFANRGCYLKQIHFHTAVALELQTKQHLEAGLFSFSQAVQTCY